MKAQLSNLLNPISKSETNLTVSAIETVVIANNPSTRSFSAADLWNIQRRHRTVNPVRRFVY
ncbi:MAG: hypothetical protein ABIO04_14180 [Ferruginibacter sp.]